MRDPVTTQIADRAQTLRMEELSMKTLRNLVPRKLLLIVMLSACQIPSAVSAQSANLQGKFRLQHEVHWGKAVLAAGDYSLTVDSRFSPENTIYVIVRSAEGTHVAVAMATATAKAEPGGNFIFIANDGTRRVRLLNLPDQNLSLGFGPLTKRDRELIYAARAEVVPVIVAKK